MSKIITFATLKGGAGKTMNLFNLAGILAEKHNVLLIDMDPQCNLSANVGIDIADTDLKTVKDIFSNYQANKQPKASEVIIAIQKAIADGRKNLIKMKPYLQKTKSSRALYRSRKSSLLSAEIYRQAPFSAKSHIQKTKSDDDFPQTEPTPAPIAN